MVRRISAQEARDRFSELIGSVRFSQEPVIVERRGQPYAVLISPEQFARFEQGGSTMPASERSELRPLSPEEKQRALAALEAAQQFQTELLAKRGGVPFEDSTELIREMREERSRHLSDLT